MVPTIDKTRLEQFSSLEFLARQVVEGFITGLHKSPFHGFSVEFAEHRLYNSGESVRDIDWKLYGRTDRLYTKRYEEETNLRCQILIDNSSSMHYPVIPAPDLSHPNKITFSVYMAAALIYLLHKQRDASGISVFSDQIELHTPAKSNAIHNRYLFTELEHCLASRSLQNLHKTLASRAIHELSERIHKRSLVIIFSDMFETNHDPEALFQALQHLKHNKHEVVLFHVTDKNKELEFDFEDRPFQFIDLETGERLRAIPSRLREHYVSTVTRFRDELKLRCGQYHIDLVEADIHAGFEQVLLPYLVKRSRLF
ncbi:MAG TPA: DUF58 domain-containing protein [Bacteroidales bacterium]|nr:DUF58 domain-containing protein [Bacteroidales bacterium]HPT09420.1 DUF58 domain-containing protein [Bacteroidales bacterium]